MVYFDATIDCCDNQTPSWRFAKTALAMLVLVLFAASLTLWTGNLGYMPLDQSIIFDGGWRVLSGQTPLADFFTPTGVVPILMQAGFFKLLGVSWTSYVAHAAVMNILFAVVVYLLLHRLFGWNTLAFYFALLSAYFMYPPMGTPYMDQHALIFTFFALALFLVGVTAETPKAQALAWSLIPVAGVLALHSKQMPSGLAIVFIAAACGFLYWRNPDRYRAGLVAAAHGSAAVLLVMIVVIALTCGFDRYFYWTFRIPLELAFGRLGGADDRFFVIAGMVSICALPILVALNFATRAGGQVRTDDIALATAGVTVALLVLAALFAGITVNAPMFQLAFFPAAIAFCYGLLSRRERGESGETARQLRDFRTLIFGLSGLAFLYALPPISQRTGNEFEFHKNKFSLSVDAANIHPALSGLHWIMPSKIDGHGGEQRASNYKSLLDEIAKRKGNFLLIGDSSILYALSGKPSVFPGLWFHEGLSIPKQFSARRRKFEKFLVRSLLRNDVRYVVVDGRETWMASQASDFAVLNACLDYDDAEAETIGHFRLLPISLQCIRGQPSL